MTDPLNAAAPGPLKYMRLTRDEAIALWDKLNPGYTFATMLPSMQGRLMTFADEVEYAAEAMNPAPSPRAWRESPEVLEAKIKVSRAYAELAEPHSRDLAKRVVKASDALDALCDAVANCGPVTHEGT